MGVACRPGRKPPDCSSSRASVALLACGARKSGDQTEQAPEGPELHHLQAQRPSNKENSPRKLCAGTRGAPAALTVQAPWMTRIKGRKAAARHHAEPVHTCAAMLALEA